MGRRKSRAISERENRSSAVIYVMSSGGDGTYFCCWMREKARTLDKEKRARGETGQQGEDGFRETDSETPTR
jgi:hypothetical protein